MPCVLRGHLVGPVYETLALNRCLAVSTLVNFMDIIPAYRILAIGNSSIKRILLSCCNSSAILPHLLLPVKYLIYGFNPTPSGSKYLIVTMRCTPGLHRMKDDCLIIFFTMKGLCRTFETILILAIMKSASKHSLPSTGHD